MKYKILIDDNNTKYDLESSNFNKAIETIFSYVHEHLDDDLFFIKRSYVPYYIGSYFYDLYSKNNEKEEDVLLDHLISKVMLTLRSDKPSFDNVKPLSANLKYDTRLKHINDYKLNINIDYSNKAIDFKYGDRCFIATNLFDITDDKTYFFSSKQISADEKKEIKYLNISLFSEE